MRPGPRWGFHILLLTASLSGLFAAPQIDPYPYNEGLASIQMLSRDIYQCLGPVEKAWVSFQPVLLETCSRPSIRLFRQVNGAEVTRGIMISEEFIHFVNQFAHAEAIDQKRKGYLRRYLELVQRDEDHLPLLPEGNTPAFWTQEMLNKQESNFNSIVGTLVSINLAHHYLGHYQKYAQPLENTTGVQVAINDLLTREEWEESYRLGVLNAMNAGCMSEGILPFVESVSRMKDRPSWMVFFLPEHFDFRAMCKEIVRLQRRFLAN